MKRLYLIRHGEPAFPGGEKMCLGTTDLPLSRLGQQQAAAMAEALPAVAAVYSSPLLRARETAQAIGLPVLVMDGLKERHQGLWDGLTFRQICREYPQLYQARAGDPTIPPPESEPAAAALGRFAQGIRQIAQDSPGDCAVVTHRGVMRLFLDAIGIETDAISYCQIISLEYEAGRFQRQEG